ncbi:DNA polymerase epsilon subunit 3 [Lutzomyia longipalpis]|uniref:DNA polymerase epsilon subunit 3 n=1 Tax=Lutzomyia longipalpis TaxID=7200 RepID=A0A1B0CUP6_LUTLO|nr:DNA polymerase epsilon subunit 3 [Lutzomyia longipalpis]
MVDKIEDLSLPGSIVQRIVKEALPDGVNVGKEARSVLGRAASVFVIYLTASATNTAKSHNRKAITGQDILDSLEEMEFEDFLEPLKEFQEAFRKNEQGKKNKKKEATSKQAAEETNEQDEEMIVGE